MEPKGKENLTDREKKIREIIRGNNHTPEDDNPYDFGPPPSGSSPISDEEHLREARRGIAAMKGAPLVNAKEHHAQIAREKDMYMNVPLPPESTPSLFQKVTRRIKRALGR